ncbi:uncharacterized protein LOC114536615 [Dendronephthya gigantea]|uniref:uncharacterized protein LOC114536615 n=1 Tax=Dendronephthya gigantea TaxID=151771 RepID=UPI00106BEB6D|nr:uncharacterized protein LOC114536615 [Dendronephthya gigantea]
MLGATINYHLDQQPHAVRNTVQALRENTYVDNLMQTANDVDELNVFKEKATHIFESAKFPVHKWETDVSDLDEESNPSKLLGHIWEKSEDTLEIKADMKLPEDGPVTKRTILSKLSGIYDPLGIMSQTMVEGKRIYREVCDERASWNAEVGDNVKRDFLRWTGQLRNVRVPRSIAKDIRKLKKVHLHVFADASNVVCSTVTIAVIEHSTGVVKRLLTSKSRISKRNTTIARLELISGHMAANMVKNLLSALKHWPIASVTIWMDSMVALYWICNPGKAWKVFVSNRVRKIAEITHDTGIKWKHCPTEKNLADLGSRGASLNKMEKGDWFTGPDWLVDETEWPEQPKLESTKRVYEEHKPTVEGALFTLKRDPVEWDSLLEKRSYWRTLRVTAWALRFKQNALAKKRMTKKTSGPLTIEEISSARNLCVRRAQTDVQPDLETPGWKLEKEETTGIFKCKGRIQGWRMILFVSKLRTQEGKKMMGPHPPKALKTSGVKEPCSTSTIRWL